MTNPMEVDVAENSACSVPGEDCTAGGAIRGGLCERHRWRMKRYGTTSASALARRQAEHGEPMAFVFSAIRRETDECILWPYGKTPAGYGKLWYEGQLIGAHRLAYCLATSTPVDSELLVLHAPGKCHEPACINPAHLRMATQAENEADKRVDGTDVRPWQIDPPLGVKNANAKLDDRRVAEIITLLAKAAYSDREIGLMYGVHQATIYHIRMNRTWRHLPRPWDVTPSIGRWRKAA